MVILGEKIGYIDKNREISLSFLPAAWYNIK